MSAKTARRKSGKNMSSVSSKSVTSAQTQLVDYGIKPLAGVVTSTRTESSSEFCGATDAAYRHHFVRNSRGIRNCVWCGVDETIQMESTPNG